MITFFTTQEFFFMAFAWRLTEACQRPPQKKTLLNQLSLEAPTQESSRMKSSKRRALSNFRANYLVNTLCRATRVRKSLATDLKRKFITANPYIRDHTNAMGETNSSSKTVYLHYIEGKKLKIRTLFKGKPLHSLSTKIGRTGAVDSQP